MKLKNLQIQFNGVDRSKHLISYVNENGTECRETLCSDSEFAQYVIDCLEAVPPLRDDLGLVLKERDEALKFRNEYHAQLMEVAAFLGDPGAFFSSLPGEITKLHTEIAQLETARDEALERATNITEYDEGMRKAMQQIARACGKTFAVDIGYEQLPELVEELLARPGATQPQLNGLMCDELLDRLGLDAGYTSEQFHASMKVLFNDLSTLQEQVETLKTDIEYRRTTQLSEIRYVLHGDIQPCSVLYSDDTTTLLRLDEGDMMLETDTIEWSDSVTYRCQELGRSAGIAANALRGMADAMAKLVRDERILLNDNGDEEVVEQATSVVPAPPPFPRGAADHNNPYRHTNDLFTEKAMRDFGWTSEALVSCGHGHYKPAQPSDEDYAQYVKHSSAPMTRKEWEQVGKPMAPGSEWASNNSPTTLR